MKGAGIRAPGRGDYGEGGGEAQPEIVGGQAQGNVKGKGRVEDSQEAETEKAKDAKEEGHIESPEAAEIDKETDANELA